MAISPNRIPYFTGVQNQVQHTESNDSAQIVPVNDVQDSISTSLNNISDIIEEKSQKKSNKTAFAVGLSTLLVMGGVVLINPKYSTKFAQHLNALSAKTKLQMEKNKDSFLKSNFYKATLKCLDFTNKSFTVVNNINSAKDVGFKYLCTTNKYGKDKPVRHAINAAILKITKPFHEWTTTFFDKIGRKTVNLSYKKTRKKFNNLDGIIESYRSRLTKEEAKLLDKKLSAIKKEQQFFDEVNVNSRLDKQNDIMDDLEESVKNRALNYIDTMKKSAKSKADKEARLENLKDGTTFWAEDILASRKEKVMEEANKPIGKLFGDTTGKGLYSEVENILRPKLNKNEEEALNNIIYQTEARAKKSGNIETFDYFDKKRDLILGSSPTDIVSGLTLIGLSGIAIGTADSKEDKWSKFVTMGAPAILGVATSLTLAATLVSGAKCLIAGALSGALFSKIGNIVNHKIFGNKNLDDIDETSQTTDNNNVKTSV